VKQLSKTNKTSDEKKENLVSCGTFDGIILSFEKGREHWGGKKAKKYLTVGDFDRFSVIPVLENSKNISTNEFVEYYQDKIAQFAEINQVTKEDFSSEDSCHNIYGFRNKEISDSCFFEDDTSFKYMFVSLLQIENSELYSDKVKQKELKEILDKFVCKNGNDTAYCVYNSLDLSDYFIFIKTNKFKATYNFICHLNTLGKVSEKLYSYTRTGFNSSEDVWKKSAKQNINSIDDNDSFIDRLTISAIKKDNFKFMEWKEKVSKLTISNGKTECFNRLGHEDFCINLYKVPMCTFVLELISGVLSKKGYDDSIMCPKIIIDTKDTNDTKDTKDTKDMTDLQVLKDKPGVCKIVNSSYIKSLYEKFLSPVQFSIKNFFVKNVTAIDHLNNNSFTRDLKLQDHQVKIETPKEDTEAIFSWDKCFKKEFLSYIQPSIKKAFVEIVTAIGYLDNSGFARDIVKCIKYSFEMFLKEIELYNKEDSSSTSKPSKDCYSSDAFNKDVRSYLEAIMTMIQGSLHADKNFFQVPGFNATLYDSPSKLIVFYAAFIDHTIQTLINIDTGNNSIDSNRNKPTNVRFVLNIGLHLRMSTSRLFEINKSGKDLTAVDQLLDIKIPYIRLFTPKRLMAELTHEIAHFVGKEIRCRSARRKYMVECLSELLTDLLMSASIGQKKRYAKELSIIFNDQVNLANVKRDVKNYLIESYNEFCDYQVGHGEYTEDMIDLMKVVDEFLCHLVIILTSPEGFLEFSSDVAGFISEWIKNNEQQQVSDIDLQKSVYTFFSVMCNKANQIKCLEYVSALQKLMYESFADLIMIKLTDLSSEDYITMLMDYGDKYVSEMNDTKLLADYNLERWCAVFSVAYKNQNPDIFDFLNTNCNSSYEYKKTRKSICKAFISAKKKRGVTYYILIKHTMLYLNHCVDALPEIILKNSPSLDIFRKMTNADTYDDFIGSINRIYYEFLKKN
jgi:hypothetical protein